MTVIAHLSDPHLNGTERNAARVSQMLGYLAALPQQPDVVLITGDIADSGAAADYAALRALLDLLPLHCPVFCCPGNHDARSPFREHLLRLPDAGDEPINQVCRLADATVVLCDSLVPGRPEGNLTERSLSWLDDVLSAESGRPVFVAVHHPPVEVGIGWIDAIGLRNADRLAEVLTAHPDVAAVLCGHAHTAACTRFAGLPMLVAPGVASTIRLQWEGASDGRVDYDAPPAVAFHLYRNGNVVTHFRTVEVGAVG